MSQLGEVLGGNRRLYAALEQSAGELALVNAVQQAMAARSTERPCEVDFAAAVALRDLAHG